MELHNITTRNQKTFIQHILNYPGKSRERKEIVNSLKSYIANLCLILGVKEREFYSWDKHKLIQTYDELTEELFSRSTNDHAVNQIRYAFRWYMESIGVVKDPIRRRKNFKRYHPVRKIAVESQQTEPVKAIDNGISINPLANFTIIKGEDGSLYLKLT